MSRYALDLEATGLLDHTSIDYKLLPYKLKPTYKIWCAVFVDIDTRERIRLRPEEVHQIADIIKTATMLVLHNGISYDLLALKLYFGIDYFINEYDYTKCSVGGTELAIVDTMILSQYLQPDRVGGHSLASWGKRLGNHKGSYGEQECAWDVFTEDMLDYNEQDSDLTADTFFALMDEWSDWDHAAAFSMEQSINEIVVRQEHVGFYFNLVKAQEALEDLNNKLRDIEEKVEPLLPKTKLAKTNADKYKLPARQVKKDDTLSATMEKWIEAHGARLSENDYGEHIINVYGREITLPCDDREPLVTHAPMKVANQKPMKEYLVTIGWKPTEWGLRDITLKSGTKIKVTFEKYKEAVLRYCEETATSNFKDYRLKFLEVKSIKGMYQKLIHSDLTRPVRVRTSPEYTIDQEKTICPNLHKLGKDVEWIKDVILWLTYRHRRNMLKSPNGTGLMTHERIKVDGRVPTGAIVTGTNTYRFKHRVCVNIPRPSSVYGAEIRELFGCGGDFYQIGCDAASLEGRVQGHYCYPYTDGQSLAATLIAEKPNDIHSVRARMIGISRDDAKSLGYALLYGAQVAKLCSMLGCSKKEGERIFKEFWESTPALLDLKERVEKYWKAHGKKYLKGIDGRKINTRSQHSLLNALFQSAGIILMKWAAIWLDRQMDKQGLLFKPFDHDSWVGKAAQMQHYHDEYQHKVHKSLIIKDSNGNLSSIVGDLMEQAITEGGKILNMRVEFAGESMIGNNWRDCH